jgi:hypoxanthine-guanine phosphoribosyltransferase
VVFGKIEESIFKIDTYIKFNKCMNVLPAVRMILLCDDVLDDGVLLTQVLQYHLRSEVTSRVSEEPTFSFRPMRR